MNMKKVLKWAGIVVGAILLFVGAVWAVIGFLTKDAVVVANAELAAFRSGNLNDAYYAYTTKSFQNNTSFETFQKLVAASPILKTNIKVSYLGKKISSSEGVVLNGVLIGKNDSRTTIEIQLVKENGAWKIQWMNLKPRT